MANAGRRKQKNAFVEVKGELSKIRLEMNSMGEKLSSVEKDKENLRCINHALIEKIRKETEKDYPFKLFLLTRELENEREKSKLAMQRLCAKQIFAVFLQENFGTLADKDGCQTSLTMQNMMNILKVIKKQWGEEKALLKKENEDLTQSQHLLKEEMENLQNENRELREEKMAENLSSQVIIDSLEELIREQDEENQNQLQILQSELRDSKEHAEAQQKHISELEQQALLAKERLSDCEGTIKTLEETKFLLIIDVKTIEGELLALEDDARETSFVLEELSKEVRDWKSRTEESEVRCSLLAEKLWASEQREAIVGEKLSVSEEQVKKLEEDNQSKEKVGKYMEMKLKLLERSLVDAEESFEATSIKLLEMTLNMRNWKSRAQEFKTKASALEENNKNLESEKDRLLKTSIDEYSKHLKLSLAMNSNIASLQNQNKECKEKIDALAKENQMLSEEKKSKLLVEKELRAVQDRNSDLNEVISDLKQILRAKSRPWWRKIASCS
eukprot:gene8351-14320_t